MALTAAIVLMATVACGDNRGRNGAAQEAATAATAYETVPEEIVTAARKLLADELEVDEGDFKLESSDGVEWPDASLGCPKEGFTYAQVITPGYKLVFKYADTSYPVHTNSDCSHLVICKDGQ